MNGKIEDGKYDNVLVLTSSLHPLIINEVAELKNHVKNITLHEIMYGKVIVKELFSNFIIILHNIKYVILFLEMIFFNLRKFPLKVLIFWYLNLVYLLILDDKIRFKIIHAHWIYPAGIIATTYSKHISKKVIMTVHGYDADRRTFDNPKLKKLVIETGLKADCIIAGEKRLYENLEKFGLKKIIFVQPFVESPKFDEKDSRKKHGIDSNAYVIVFGPRMSKIYGCLDFAEAVVKLKSDISNLFIICIGGGEDLVNVKELFDKNNLKFKLTNQITNYEVIEYLKLSDIVCSLGYISQGIFILEAFSCGKPVIGWNDVDEIKIQDGVTGMLTKSANVDGLSKLILLLYNNPELRKKLGENAKKKVETEYSKSTRISKILSAYVQ